jgi:hypothetical protein
MTVFNQLKDFILICFCPGVSESDIRFHKKLGMFAQRNPLNPTIQSVLLWQTTLTAAESQATA